MKGLVNGMKKYLCILLAFALVLTLAACGEDPSGDNTDPDVETSGDVSDGATPTDLDAPTAEPTPTPDPEAITTLKVCGISVIKNGQLTNLAYKGVKYENGVLLLDTAVLDSGTTSDILIEFYGGDLVIEVTGECAFTSSGVPAIKGDGSVTLQGDGSLSISTAESASISVEGGVTVSCALTVTGAPAVESTGVTAGDGFAISENSETSLVVAAA